MKIYHTETQEDYDALMVELGKQGCKWSFDRKLTEINRWHVDEHLTCLRVYDSKVNHASLNYYKEEYPHITITKYKAKADDKMKFTKENVYKMVERYSVDQGYLISDLKSDIFKLDDTPEKVVVPKFVAEFYEGCKNANLYFLITQLESEDFQSDLGKWHRDCEGRHISGKANAQEVIAKMKLYGYEVEKEPFSWAVKGITDYFKCDGKIIVFKNEEEALEVANLIGINTEIEKMNNIDCQDCISIEELRNEKKEQLYYVALPKLDDSDFRYLWTDVDGTVYTQARKGLCIGKLKHTEAEIKAIDERYWPFAVPAND